MNKIKFFTLAVLTVLIMSFVSCTGKKSEANTKQDVTYEGKLGSIEFKGENVICSIDGGISKGTYNGNPNKDGTIVITINEESKDNGESYYEYSAVYNATIENNKLTLMLDDYPFYFTLKK